MNKDDVDLYDVLIKYSYSELKEKFHRATTKDEQDFYIVLSNLVLQREQAKVVGK